MPKPNRPCPFCSSADYVVTDGVSIEVATTLPTPDRFVGSVIVCRGCGHVDYFVDDVAAFAGAARATEMTVPADPYRS